MLRGGGGLGLGLGIFDRLVRKRRRQAADARYRLWQRGPRADHHRGRGCYKRYRLKGVGVQFEIVFRVVFSQCEGNVACYGAIVFGNPFEAIPSEI